MGVKLAARNTINPEEQIQYWINPPFTVIPTLPGGSSANPLINFFLNKTHFNCAIDTTQQTFYILKLFSTHFTSCKNGFENRSRLNCKKLHRIWLQSNTMHSESHLKFLCSLLMITFYHVALHLKVLHTLPICCRLHSIAVKNHNFIALHLIASLHNT